jgi:hypothetical protein
MFPTPEAGVIFKSDLTAKKSLPGILVVIERCWKFVD